MRGSSPRMTGRGQRGVWIDSDVHALLGDGPALLHVEAIVIDRPLAGSRARVLDEQHLATRCGLQGAFEVRIGVEQHSARLEQFASDRELAGKDVPDLRKAMTVLRM